MAVTGQAGVMALSADAGFCRDSGKLEEATCNNLAMNQESPITSFMRPFPGTTLSSAVAIMLWYWTAQPLASYTRHIAMYSILRHTTPSQQEARRLRFVPEEQTPKAIHRPTKGLGSTFGRIHSHSRFALHHYGHVGTDCTG